MQLLTPLTGETPANYLDFEVTIDRSISLDSRFITTPAGETIDMQPTLNRIQNGEILPFDGDEAVFQNKEGLLPSQPLGYYNKYVLPSPNIFGPGPL